MRRSRHVTVDLAARGRDRDRIARAALSDAALVARTQAGDLRSRDALVERHADRVARIARRRFRDPEEALDAAQEALGRVVEGLAGFRGEAGFTTWLHRVAVNACADHARRLARDRRRDAAAGAVADAATIAAPAEPGVDGALARSLAALPEPHRRAIVLKALTDWRDEDLAAALAVPVGTAKCHLHRGRRELAARLRRTA